MACFGERLLRVRDLWRRPEGWIAFAFAALMSAISLPEVWMEAYAFGRAFPPLIFVAGCHALRTRSYAGALPLVLIAPRIGVSVASQAGHAVRSLLGF